MNKQTLDYITLKPIAERFKEVAASITDDEIRSLIKQELREQIHDQVAFGPIVGEWVDTWVEDEDNCEFVMKCIKESIETKFFEKEKRRY